MGKPQFFYKFVSFDRKDILENGLIRFAPLDNFNDPFELEPMITPYSRQYLEYASKLSDDELVATEFNEEDEEYSLARACQVKEYREKYRREIGKYGVLSLSSNKYINPLLTVAVPDKKDPRTNILMWSHYADSHRGFVIEFSQDFMADIKLQKVEYSDERDCLTFEDINERKFDNIFYKKSSEWEYEQEYRVVLPLDGANVICNDIYHLFKVNKGSVRSITFGCAMKKENKKIIMNLINKDDAFQRVAFNHARLSEEGFFLDFYYDDGRWSNNNDFFDVMQIPNQKKI